jgi:hypothetical protein
VDGYRLSTFFYKKRDSDGGKIFMGPLWDFNLGFGNADYCNGGPAVGFAYHFNEVCNQDDFLMPFWWDRLLEDADFKTKVADRWTELRATKWKESTIHTYIDSVANALNAGPQQRNFSAWNVLNKYVWPNYYVGSTFSAEVNWIKDWISQRLVWLDLHIQNIITDTETSVVPESDLKVYPNPFSSDVNFEYTITKAGKVQVKLMDSIGKLVRSAEVDHTVPGRYVYALQPNISKSFYFYIVEQDSKLLGNGKLMKE